MKVTMQDVFDSVKKVTFTLLPDERTTICQLTLTNGYTVTGQSSVVDTAEFNKAMGEKIAYEDALGKVWPLLGYALTQQRFTASQQT